MSLNAIWKATDRRCNEIYDIIIQFESLPRAYQVLDEDEHWLLAIALQKLVVERLYELRPRIEMVKTQLAAARMALVQGLIFEFDTDMSNMVARVKAHVDAWNSLKGEHILKECLPPILHVNQMA
ncbi:hypothetical protein LY76DRAFT_639398 [Colletotrichum caudatum]|nr:hypothetical protein LY76DRAFT_639398 [Colletotrichum caudatum]